MCQGYLCPLEKIQGTPPFPWRLRRQANASERGTCMSAMIGEHSPVTGGIETPDGGRDAIAACAAEGCTAEARAAAARAVRDLLDRARRGSGGVDRKSTRLNSSHSSI